MRRHGGDEVRHRPLHALAEARLVVFEPGAVVVALQLAKEGEELFVEACEFGHAALPSEWSRCVCLTRSHRGRGEGKKGNHKGHKVNTKYTKTIWRALRARNLGVLCVSWCSLWFPFFSATTRESVYLIDPLPTVPSGHLP